MIFNKLDYLQIFNVTPRKSFFFKNSPFIRVGKLNFLKICLSTMRTLIVIELARRTSEALLFLRSIFINIILLIYFSYLSFFSALYQGSLFLKSVSSKSNELSHLALVSKYCYLDLLFIIFIHTLWHNVTA